MATLPKHGRASAIAGAFGYAGMPGVLIIAALVVGMAALLPLLQSSGATSTAGNIQKLESEKRDWQARIRELELEVATLGSLDRIEREARARLGMTTPKEVRYIYVDQPPPEERRLPSRFLPEAPPPPHRGEPLLDQLFGWILP
jgi:cell division protein FtsL